MSGSRGTFFDAPPHDGCSPRGRQERRFRSEVEGDSLPEPGRRIEERKEGRPLRRMIA
jgi:hypothetical protein